MQIAPRRLLLAGSLAFALLAPVETSAQTQRVSIRGALGLSTSFGDLHHLDPGTTWEYELRVRPVSSFSIGGGMRGMSRKYFTDTIKTTGWFLEPRLHGPALGSTGLIAFSLAVRATKGEVVLERPTATGPSDGFQIEVGPVGNFRVGSRVTLEAGLMVGWEDAGSANYPTPADLGTGIGLAARAGLTIGVY